MSQFCVDCKFGKKGFIFMRCTKPALATSWVNNETGIRYHDELFASDVRRGENCNHFERKPTQWEWVKECFK